MPSVRASRTGSNCERCRVQGKGELEGNGLRIHESYTDFKPRVNVTGCVARLVASTPPDSLTGLGCINLRDRGGLSRQEIAKRKQRAGKESLLGSYYPGTARRRAAIDLFVDAILGALPQALLRIPLVLDVRLGRVLFHEIGHHVDARVAPGIRSNERAAETWSKGQLRTYLRRRYWYLIPARPLFAAGGRLLQGLRRRRDRLSH